MSDGSREAAYVEDLWTEVDFSERFPECDEDIQYNEGKLEPPGLITLGSYLQGKSR